MLDYISHFDFGKLKKKIQLTAQLSVTLCKSLYQIVSMNNIYQEVQYNDHIDALSPILYLKFT